MDPQAQHPIRIGTRRSDLALHRAGLVRRLLETRGHTAELVTFRTAGDRKPEEPVASISVEGLFTQELETALARGKVDCCVHALSDLPVRLAEGLAIGAVLERDDPRDVLLIAPVVEVETLADLPRGSRVGTSSVRRRAQLAASRADLDIVELRGSVPERVQKVDAGFVHATILGAAELQQLGVRQRVTQVLAAPAWLPAPGQGAVVVEVRADDARMREIATALDHPATRAHAAAERAFLGALEGGCQAPIGALAMPQDGAYVLHGLLATMDGGRVVRGEIVLDRDEPELGGIRLANQLRGEGATEILEDLRRATRLPAPQPD